MRDDEIAAWIRKYPFLEAIIRDCRAGIFAIIEEPAAGNEGLGRCRTSGYDSTQGESTSWEWYGACDMQPEKLEAGMLGDALGKKNFDYAVTHEHITTELFDDDTIRIYKLKGG